MKKLLATLTFTVLLLPSCSSGPSTSQAKAQRGPASMEAPKVWGKPVTQETQDFLDEVENAPAGKYKGQP